MFHPQCSFLCYHGSVRRGIGTCGKHSDRCGDPWEDREVVLCFTYTPVSTHSFDVGKSRELRARADERSVAGGKLTFHILPSSKVPMFQVKSLSLLAPSVRSSFPYIGRFKLVSSISLHPV